MGDHRCSAVSLGGVFRHHADPLQQFVVVPILKEADIPPDLHALRHDVVGAAPVDLARADDTGVKGVVVLGGNAGDSQQDVAGGLDGVHRLVGAGTMAAHPLPAGG